MDPLVVAAVSLLTLAGGAVLGFVARGMFASRAMKQAEEKAALIIEKAYSQQKDLILEAKDEKLRLQREAEDEARAKRAELANLERRLLQRDEQLDQRADMLEQRDRKLIDRERELDRAREEVARARQDRSSPSSGSAACRPKTPRGSCSRPSARKPSTTRSSSPARSSARPGRRPTRRRAT